MNNYLLKILEGYFSEILSIEGNLILSESFLSKTKDDIINEKRSDNFIASAITSYRDLSLIKADVNLFTPNYSYSITTDNIENEIKNIISQYCCFAISQAYEIFENFLIEILTEFLYKNQEKLKLVKFATNDIILVRETIRYLVKQTQKTNNKGLLSMIRKISPYFRRYEAKNIYEVGISQWFDLVSMIRHTLVHNRQIISQKLIDYLNAQKANKMFDRHFQRKRIGNNICIFLEKDITFDILTWLNTFAHYIFKSISLEANLSLEIPQYIPPPLNLSQLST